MWIMVAIKREELDDKRELERSWSTPLQSVLENEYTGGE